MSNLSDIEDSLNIVSCLRKYKESYRDIDFAILQQTDQSWRMFIDAQLLTPKFDSYKEAFAYAMGYIDGCIDDMVESDDYE